MRYARLLATAFAAAAAALLALVAAAYVLIETGEVVTLVTRDERGGTLSTRLWAVDHDGDPWIGTSDPAYTRWVPRLRAEPRVQLVRGNRMECRVARFVDDPALRATVNRLFAEKYRVQLHGSRFLRLLGGARAAGERTPIRLEPCPADGGIRGSGARAEESR
jgi:hypothetical protein